MTERTAPFHCPFCGEGDLYPHESDTPGAWECRSCLRAFTVRMLGMVRPQGGAR